VYSEARGTQRQQEAWLAMFRSIGGGGGLGGLGAEEAVLLVLILVVVAVVAWRRF
jgi:hypothetical protein